MVSKPVTEMDAEETLAAFEVWHAEQRDREIRQLVAAAHFADLHNGEVRDVSGRVLPGMEIARRLGGPGTPKVMEFAAAELGARSGRSPYAGRMLMADALDVRHRLPKIWARLLAGEVVAGYARLVAQQTRELSQDAAAWVDGEVAGYADGRLGWSRFDTLVQGKVVAADPGAAAERERAAAEDEFAKVGRCNEHGQKTLYVRSAAAAMIRIDATIAYLAQALAALGDTDTEDHRRAKAMLILANPVQALQLLQAFAAHRTHQQPDPADAAAQAKDTTDPAGREPLLPDDTDDTDDMADDSTADETRGAGGCSSGGAVPAGFTAPFRPHQIRPDARFRFGFDPSRLLPSITCYLHLFTDNGQEDATHGVDVGPVVRWEGEGPVTSAYVREVLGPYARFTVRPVLDVAGMAPVDAYEVPDRHREAVHLRTPADVFPFASNTDRRKQADHTEPYVPPDEDGPPGQTGMANLGPLTQFHHRVKTFGAWQVKQPFPGIYLWRDPHGRIYLVDHTGTRPLGKSPPAGRAGPEITVEVYPDPDDDPTLPEFEYDEQYHYAA